MQNIPQDSVTVFCCPVTLARNRHRTVRRGRRNTVFTFQKCHRLTIRKLYTPDNATRWEPRQYPSPDHYARAVESVLAGTAPGLYGFHMLTNAIERQTNIWDIIELNLLIIYAYMCTPSQWNTTGTPRNRWVQILRHVVQANRIKVDERMNIACRQSW